jgi:hypothetical protein
VLGAYMASKNHLWGEAWLLVALGALAVITVVGLAVIQPATAGLSELARADVDATAAGATVAWSDGYRRLYARYMAAEVLLGALVLIAVFFMTAKPFA